MKFINRFLEGGPAPTPAADPAAQAPQDPTAQLLQGAQEAVQSGNCDVAMQVCQMVVEMLAGGAPEEAAPEEAAPAPAEGEPVYRKGGRLLRRIKE